MSESADPVRVLVVQHQGNTPAGWLGEWLVTAGATLDVRRAFDGDPLPDDLAGHDALVVLGGGMDAWDDAGHPWFDRTRALVREGAERGLPTFGVCLGHQLAAVALGGQVARNPAGSTLAVVPVGWQETVAEDKLLGPVRGARWGLHWNQDVVTELPEGAVVLARSPDGAVQAARYAPTVWGVQAHPEASPEILRTWVREEGAPYVAAGYDLDRFVADAESLESELASGWAGLGTALVDLARRVRS